MKYFIGSYEFLSGSHLYLVFNYLAIKYNSSEIVSYSVPKKIQLPFVMDVDRK